jgi:hypothetical protein
VLLECVEKKKKKNYFLLDFTADICFNSIIKLMGELEERSFSDFHVVLFMFFLFSSSWILGSSWKDLLFEVRFGKIYLDF